MLGLLPRAKVQCPMPGSMLTVSCPCGLSGSGSVGVSLVDGKLQGRSLVYDPETETLRTVEGSERAGIHDLPAIPDPTLATRGSQNTGVYRCPRCGEQSLQVDVLGSWD